MAIKASLREKKISKGRKSLYLAFYPAIPYPETGEPTRREFIGLYINEKPKTPIAQHLKNYSSPITFIFEAATTSSGYPVFER